MFQEDMLKRWLLTKRSGNGLPKQCCKQALKYSQPNPKTE
jgi:hypothetical protein